MCHPEDVDLLTRMIEKGLSDTQWREQAIRQGLEQARRFSWESCAKQTVNAYKHLASGRARLDGRLLCRYDCLLSAHSAI